MESQSVSLNKFISSTGICSRREADKLIEAGRIKINGKKAEKGNRVESSDVVKLDGKKIGSQAKSIYLVLNKPPGITCTTDHSDRDNIVDFIGLKKRIFPVGRLDKASSGLIILTNDGDIVNQILRKENKHEKEYIVTVNKDVTDRFVKRMSNGLPILGTKTDPCQVTKIGKSKFKIVLRQGLNRQIRRMCEFLGYKVYTLKRIRIMHLELGELKQGHWRYLTSKEFSRMKKEIG